MKNLRFSVWNSLVQKLYAFKVERRHIGMYSDLSNEGFLNLEGENKWNRLAGDNARAKASMKNAIMLTRI